MYELHVISDGIMPLFEFAGLAAGIHPYVTAIHLREKRSTALEIWTGVQRMLDQGVPPGKITINDRLDVAWACGVGGIHLANHSLPLEALTRLPGSFRIGRSVHEVEEARRCAAAGADYLFFGHIYASRSKPGLAPRGLAMLREVVAASRAPVIAIGGIGTEHIDEVLEHGAQGIAVISHVLRADKPVNAAKVLAHRLQEANFRKGR